ncbi:hypothetical protein Hanom_Chr16g01505561 [Helianthus anomalus]
MRFFCLCNMTLKYLLHQTLNLAMNFNGQSLLITNWACKGIGIVQQVHWNLIVGYVF